MPLRGPMRTLFLAFDPVRSASTRFPAREKENQVKIGTPGISREKKRKRKQQHQFRRFLTKHRANVCRSITFKGRLLAGRGGQLFDFRSLEHILFQLFQVFQEIE